jgi:hypothetical protein
MVKRLDVDPLVTFTNLELEALILGRILVIAGFELRILDSPLFHLFRTGSCRATT